MVIINGGRGSGKTVTLLLKDTARNLGLDIPEPLIWSRGEQGRGRIDKRVLIDDAEQFFQMMLALTYGAQAQIMTINAPVLDIEEWKKIAEKPSEIDFNYEAEDV